MNQKQTLLSALPRLLFFPAALLWLECILKWWTLGSPFGQGFLLTAAFSASLGLLLAGLCCIGSQKVNRILTGTLLGVITLWLMANAVYHTIFKTFAALDSLSMAGEAIGS